MPALCALLEFLETNDLFQLCMFGSFRHVKITDDPFDDNVGNSDVETPGKTPLSWTVSSKYFLAHHHKLNCLLVFCHLNV